jgi:hypothetical protein
MRPSGGDGVTCAEAEFVDYRLGEVWQVDGYWKYRDSAKGIFGNQ